MSQIKLVRIYEHDQPIGYRVLVDRVWPRGMSKVKAQLDNWAKEIAPSNELRKWFNHEDEKFPEFKKRYLAELDHNDDTTDFVKMIKQELKKQDVILLYGAKNKEHNQAVVLKEYLDNKL